MILIAGVSMIIVFGMPYLMDNSMSSSECPPCLADICIVDPEMKAEFEERQKASSLGSGQPANPLQNFDAAAWLAGSSSSKKTESSPRVVAEERGITR
jgi:hypothetical protein